MQLVSGAMLLRLLMASGLVAAASALSEKSSTEGDTSATSDNALSPNGLSESLDLQSKSHHTLDPWWWRHRKTRTVTQSCSSTATATIIKIDINANTNDGTTVTVIPTSVSQSAISSEETSYEPASLTVTETVLAPYTIFYKPPSFTTFYKLPPSTLTENITQSTVTETVEAPSTLIKVFGRQATSASNSSTLEATTMTDSSTVAPLSSSPMAVITLTLPVVTVYSSPPGDQVKTSAWVTTVTATRKTRKHTKIKTPQSTSTAVVVPDSITTYVTKIVPESSSSASSSISSESASSSSSATASSFSPSSSSSSASSSSSSTADITVKVTPTAVTRYHSTITVLEESSTTEQHSSSASPSGSKSTSSSASSSADAQTSYTSASATESQSSSTESSTAKETSSSAI